MSCAVRCTQGVQAKDKKNDKTLVPYGVGAVHTQDAQYVYTRIRAPRPRLYSPRSYPPPSSPPRLVHAVTHTLPPFTQRPFRQHYSNKNESCCGGSRYDHPVSLEVSATVTMCLGLGAARNACFRLLSRPPLLDDGLEEELAGLVAGAHHWARRNVKETHPLWPYFGKGGAGGEEVKKREE